MNSQLPAASTQAPQAKKINEAVYELYRPTDSEHLLDVVFFHGLQLVDYSKAYTETWVTEKGDECWPQTWLPQRFPRARVLSVSYDSAAIRGAKRGNMDMESTGQNLVELVIRSAAVGQETPAILVGHSLGGLVIKQICLKAEASASENSSQVECRKFLHNLKGTFFYATPHHGSTLASVAASMPLYPSALLKYLTLLNTETETLNYGFDELRRRYKWKAWGVGEAREVFLPGLQRGLLVVPEQSARCDMDYFAQLAEDHVTICKPREQSNSSYQYLIAFILSIVDKVHTLSGVPLHAAGLHSQAESVKELLEKAPLVGIVGTSGVGKTTIATAVFNSISHEFEFTCFIHNMKSSSSPVKLEARILASLYHKGRKVRDCEGDWSILEGKKLLLVLDNVCCKDQITLLLNKGWSKQKSRFIVTSSKEEHLRALGFRLYSVRCLNFAASEKLFCHHAFKQPKLPAELKRLKSELKRVVERCEGIPLVLQSIGSHLNRPKFEDYQEQEWKETAEKLECADENGEQRIERRLKLSVASLELHEKDMFVDLGTIFFGWSLQKVQTAWSTSRASWETAWQKLLNRSLVKTVHLPKLNGDAAYMHDVLRNLAEGLALENNSRVWDYQQYDFISKRSHQIKKNDDVEGLKLVRWNKGLESRLDLDSLVRLPRLKFLILKNVPLAGSTDSLPSDLSLLQLRTSAGSTVSINSLSGMRKTIAALDIDTRQSLLRRESIKLDALANELGEVKELLSLKIDGDFQQLPENFGDLRQLRDLTFSSGPRMTNLPESFGSLSSLETLEVHNSGLLNLPRSFGFLRKLKSLTLELFHLTELTESFGDLHSLERLKLSCCEKLERLPESFGNLIRLEHLGIHVCPKLSALPETFGNLNALKVLEISYCLILTWPSIFGPLSSLQKLEIVGMDHLPEDLGSVSSLKKLYLSEVDGRSLPASLGRLSSLHQIQIKNCRFMGEWHLEFRELGWIGYHQVMQQARDTSLLDVCVYLRDNYLGPGPERMEELANRVISRHYPHPSRWKWPEVKRIGDTMNKIRKFQ
ncbi:hypothetical protein R1sor_023285 [Riccia sorocarpa]|uniref:Uncharacterized protein n=1 Tax=Riccia sorocarpa TaxID=122646 RepID=A0ABD3GT79_9MARC